MDSQRATEKQRQDAQQRQKKKEPASLTSRIANSASQLAKDVIGSSSAAELPSALAAASGSKLQNGSSSSTQHQWMESLPSRARPSGFSATGQVDSATESFRSAVPQGSQDTEFDDFLNSSYHSLLPDLTRDSQSPESWTTEFRQQPALHHSHVEYQPTKLSSTYDDGTEVRMLLSDPSLDLGTDYMDFEMQEAGEPSMEDLFGGTPSAGEKQAMDRIKSSLPAPPVHQPVPRENAHNLVPSLLELSASIHEDLPIEELVKAMDINAWEEVLDQYTDVVWGQEDLQKFVDMVENGQFEQELGHADQLPINGPALTRLRMILGHVAEMANSKTASTVTQKPDRYAEAPCNVALGMSSTHYGQQPSTLRYSENLQRNTTPPVEQNQEEQSAPAFHCPWVRCHQRFKNARELRLHTGAHTQYACPHEDCTAQFQSHEEWAEHITGPHHDLLDNNLPRTPMSTD